MVVPVALLVTACNATVLSNAEVLSVDSTQNLNPTGEFTVVGKWDLTYSWDCSSQLSEGVAGADRFAFSVYNADDDSLAADQPTVTATGRKGGTTVHHQRGGTYYIKLTTVCDWRLAVDDLSS